jgi:bifunctional enzyme CysN/CysC
MENILKVVVAGDVDSGKSTLIGRFLYALGTLSQGAIEEIEEVCQRLKGNFEFAYLLDSFEEERRNRLTIDTTQAFCKTKSGKQFVFIDVPGHKELLKNMLCGSSYADMAILVVDVLGAIEQQTKRHAFILKFLGIKQIIVVVNKMDLVNFDGIIFNRVKAKVSGYFQKIQLKPKYFVPISAIQGENLLEMSKKMDWYKGLSLVKALNTCFRKKNKEGLRFSIQDIYNINKEKVVVGSIVSGKIKKGEKVTILPLNKECKIKAIKVFNKNKSAARAPEGIGLVLNNMDGLERGQIICKPRLPMARKEILTKIFCVRPLNVKENFSFRCLTQETPARLSQIIGIWDIASLEPKSKDDILKEADFAEVIIVTENPVVVESFIGLNSLGRFVLLDSSEICAVGIIP